MNRSDLPYIFLRVHMQGLPSIALARRERGGGHVLVWGITFEAPIHREFLMAWLDRKSSRWPFWGAIASMQGAAALSRNIDEAVEEQAMAGAPVMIQIYRAAAYLGCSEGDLLAFRNRDECSELFDDEPDPLLDERDVTFVDLGGLVRCMIDDAVARAEGPQS